MHRTNGVRQLLSIVDVTHVDVALALFKMYARSSCLSGLTFTLPLRFGQSYLAFRTKASCAFPYNSKLVHALPCDAQKQP
jgi:hypothetical protein